MSTPNDIAVTIFARSLRIQPEDVWAVASAPSAHESPLAHALRIQPEDVRAIRSFLGGSHE